MESEAELMTQCPQCGHGAMERKSADKELGAVAAFVEAVDNAIVDYCLGYKLRVDAILRTRRDLCDVCCGYVPSLRGEDYVDHATYHYGAEK